MKHISPLVTHLGVVFAAILTLPMVPLVLQGRFEFFFVPALQALAVGFVSAWLTERSRLSKVPASLAFAGLVAAFQLAIALVGLLFKPSLYYLMGEPVYWGALALGAGFSWASGLLGWLVLWLHNGRKPVLTFGLSR